MKTLMSSQKVTVRYKSEDFAQIINYLRRERIATEATLLIFTGMPMAQMEIAARELVASLGKTVFRHTLKAVASKYIGETEKNLSIIFDTAESAGGVLLFDEGDELFGKRTDAEDSHERFDNEKGNYFLRQVQRCRGIVIVLSQTLVDTEVKKWKMRRVIVKFPPL